MPGAGGWLFIGNPNDVREPPIYKKFKEENKHIVRTNNMQENGLMYLY